MMEYHYGYVNNQLGNKTASENYYSKALADYTRFVNSSLTHKKRIYVLRLAALYAGLGEKNKAYENLRILDKERFFALRDVILIKNDPLFNGIRNEPEFQKIVKEMESKYQAEHERVKKWLCRTGKISKGSQVWLPLLVIPGRLERPTNRTGICHSIH